MAQWRDWRRPNGEIDIHGSAVGVTRSHWGWVTAPNRFVESQASNIQTWARTKCSESKALGRMRERTKADSSLTTPELHAKEHSPLFGDPERKDVRGPVREE